MLKILSKKINLEILQELQEIREIYELFEIYGDNLKNMDPDQLKILELDFLDCLRKMRGA